MVAQGTVAPTADLGSEPLELHNILVNALAIAHVSARSCISASPAGREDRSSPATLP